jgi:hypothetical protein
MQGGQRADRAAAARPRPRRAPALSGGGAQPALPPGHQVSLRLLFLGPMLSSLLCCSIIFLASSACFCAFSLSAFSSSSL